MDPWRVTPEERMKHDEQFMQLKPVGSFITGEQAKGFFLQSQLPPVVLGQIWALADFNSDGKMDVNEFSIAMKLIQMKLKGFEVPKALPPGLKMMPSVPAMGTMPRVSNVMGMMPPATNIPSVTPGLVGVRPINSGTMIPPPQAVGLPPTGFAQQHFRPPPRPAGCEPSIMGPGVVGGNIPSASMNVVTMANTFPRSGSPVEYKTQRSNSVTSQESPTGSVGSPLQEWAVPHQSKLKYTQLFNTNDRTRTGYITGPQARNILVQTGLPQNVLAQIWSLADIDNDGKLTCEEFCLALHLADCVRAGDRCPTVLPPELIPPSYRRVRSASIQSGSGLPTGQSLINDIISLSEMEDDDKRKPAFVATFEDKRRENFEKGQAELEKRRQALVESQRKEQEERERKDREEHERKERIRQEQERRRQMELEKQLAKQRELEQEKEEQRKKAMEQREAARREMERQRQLELEKQRRQELMTQRQREQESVLQLKARNQSLTIELEQLNERIKDLNGKLSDARNGVNELKGAIDHMRTTRDRKINELESVKNEIKNQNQKLLLISQEKMMMQTQMKSNMSGNPTVESFNIVMHSFNNKHITLKQLKEKLSNLEQETSQKLQDIDNNNVQLQDLKTQLGDMVNEGERLYSLYISKREQVIEMRKQRGLEAHPTETATTAWASNDAWNDNGAMDAGVAPAQDAWGANDNWATQGNGAPTEWGTDDAAWPPSTDANWANQEAPAEWGEPAANDKWAENGQGTDQAWPADTHPIQENGTAQDQTVTKYRVLYAFEARNPDELSIEPGDIVMVPAGMANEPGWLGGELHGKTGWFPEAYVEPVITEEPVNGEASQETITTPTSITGVKETVHIVGTEMKMTLSGIQETLENVSDNGSITDLNATTSTQDSHLISSAFTHVHKPVMGGAVSPLPGKGLVSEGLQAQALFPWRAKKENHLTFNKGDVIVVKEQQDMWWYGETENSKAGWFPKSYVKLIAGPRRAGEEDNTQPEQPELVQEAVTPVTEYYEAVYSYQSSETGDLSFVQGDTVMVTKKDGDWWTGIIGDRTGVFPSNYVRKIENQLYEDQDQTQEVAEVAEITEIYEEQVQITESVPDTLGEIPDVVPQPDMEETADAAQQQREAPEPLRSPKLKQGKKPEIAMVIAPYAATGPEQLSLQRGQLIQLRKKSQNGWWEGELQAKGKKRQIGWFPASYVKILTSSARNTPEPRGEPVIAMYPYEAQNEDELSFQKGATISLVSKDEGAWWKGECNGAVGLFPANYVQPADSQVQPAGSTLQWLKELLALPPEERKRQESIRELMNTEQAYMEDMSIVYDAFRTPLKDARVCTDEELEAIFVNWQDLIACNLKLLKAFRVRKKMSTGGVIPIIGDILCEYLPHLTPYIRFCSCQLNAAALIQKKTETSSEFKALARKCCRDPRTKGMPLSSFLLKPMQRITKYPLIIKRIIQYTPSDHPDSVYLEDALQHAEELCSQVNEGVRERENSDRLEWIQQHVHCDGLIEKITFNSMTNSLGPRKYLHSGILYKAKSNKELMAFLFNDFLLLTQPQKQLSGTSSLHLEKLNNVHFKLYKQPVFLNEIMIMPQEGEDELHFQISHVDRVYNVKATTLNEKNSWVKKLEEASKHYIETERKSREKTHSLRAQRTTGVGRLLVVVIEGVGLKSRNNVILRQENPKGKLKLTIIEAEDLTNIRHKGCYDAYCEVSMGSQEHRTKVISESNPKWNATMQFIIKDVEQDVLCITVFERDYFSPNEFLGRTEVRIADILHESRYTKDPIIKKLHLYEVESGEVVVKFDLQLFDIQ